MRLHRGRYRADLHDKRLSLALRLSTAPGATEFTPTGPDNGDRDPDMLDRYLESIGHEPIFRPPKKTRAKLKEFVSGSD